MRKQTYTLFLSCKRLKYDYQNPPNLYKNITVPSKALSSRDLELLQENIHQRSGTVTANMVCIKIAIQEKIEYESSQRKRQSYVRVNSILYVPFFSPLFLKLVFIRVSDARSH